MAEAPAAQAVKVEETVQEILDLDSEETAQEVLNLDVQEVQLSGSPDNPAAAVVADDHLEGPLQSKNRVCTDSLFCIIFFACWAVNFVVFGLAYAYGDVQRLVMATDYEGNTCGEAGRGALGYYPRLSEDVIVAMQAADSCIADATTGAVGDCDVTLYTVCVDACPAAGDIVCNYQRDAELSWAIPGSETEGLGTAKRLQYALAGDGCWVTPMASQLPAVANRCVPAIDQMQSVSTWECDGRPIETSQTATCRGMLTETTVTKFNTTAGSQVLFAGLVQTTYTVGKYLNDVETSWGTIWVFGLGLSILASVVYVIALQYIAGLLVWLLVLCIWILCIVCTVIAFVKGGMFFGVETAGYVNDLSQTSTQFATINSHLESSSDIERTISEAVGYVFLMISLLYFCVVCALSGRIGLAIEVIKVAGQTVKYTKLLFLVPVVNWVCLLCLSAYAFAGVALIYTLEFSHADLQLAVQQAGTQAAAGLQQAACAAGTTEVECVASAVNTTAGGQVLLNLTAFNSTNVTVVDGSDTSLMWPMMWYHIFCALWCMNLYNALGTMIIAGAVAEVFWTKDRVATECAHKLPTIDSLCYILKYHFGSAALGALIIALVQMVRLVLMYIQQQTEEMAESSRAVKCVLKAIQCCMWCFEKCIKYLSHNAYVMVAIDGQTFCHAAWTSFSLLLANPLRVPMVQALARLLGYMIRAFVVLLCTIPAHAEFTGMEAAGGIYSKWLPTALVFVLSFLVATAFSEVWNVAVDTVLFSFLLDNKRVAEGSASITETHWPELYDYLDKKTKKKDVAQSGRDRLATEAMEGSKPIEVPEAKACCCGGTKQVGPAGGNYTGASA